MSSAVGEQLGPGGEVDAVEARPAAPAARRSGRAPRARRPRAASGPAPAGCCRARSSRRRRPAACPGCTSRSGLSLSRMPSWRIVCDGWMKVRPDVGVLDQALAVRDAGRLGVADRGRGAGLRHRDHQVGLDRVLLGQPAADLAPGRRARCGRRSWCPGGPGRRTRTGSPWAPARRTGWSAGRPRRWRSARPARPRGPRWRRRCPARRSRWPPPSRAPAGRAPAGARRAGRGPRRASCSSMKTKLNAPRSCGSTSSAAASTDRSGGGGASSIGDQRRCRWWTPSAAGAAELGRPRGAARRC